MPVDRSDAHPRYPHDEYVYFFVGMLADTPSHREPNQVDVKIATLLKGPDHPRRLPGGEHFVEVRYVCLTALVPWGLFLIQRVNLRMPGWEAKASSVLYSCSSSLFSIAAWTFLWQGRHSNAIRLSISRRSNAFLARFFLCRDLGMR